MFFNISNLLINNQEISVHEIIGLNKITEKYDLTLTREQAIELVNHRNAILKEVGRVELGGGILEKLIYEFCDSSYIIRLIIPILPQICYDTNGK